MLRGRRADGRDQRGRALQPRARDAERVRRHRQRRARVPSGARDAATTPRRPRARRPRARRRARAGRARARARARAARLGDEALSAPRAPSPPALSPSLFSPPLSTGAALRRDARARAQQPRPHPPARAARLPGGRVGVPSGGRHRARVRAARAAAPPSPPPRLLAAAFAAASSPPRRRFVAAASLPRALSPFSLIALRRDRARHVSLFLDTPSRTRTSGSCCRTSRKTLTTAPSASTGSPCAPTRRTPSRSAACATSSSGARARPRARRRSARAEPKAPEGGCRLGLGWVLGRAFEEEHGCATCPPALGSPRPHVDARRAHRVSTPEYSDECASRYIQRKSVRCAYASMSEPRRPTSTRAQGRRPPEEAAGTFTEREVRVWIRVFSEFSQNPISQSNSQSNIHTRYIDEGGRDRARAPHATRAHLFLTHACLVARRSGEIATT